MKIKMSVACMLSRAKNEQFKFDALIMEVIAWVIKLDCAVCYR